MAINGTMELINSITVGSGGQPTIEFTNISQAYDDLVIVVSARGTSNSGNAQNFFAVRPNGSTSGYTYRRLLQDGNSIASDTAVWIFMPSSLATSNVFGSCQIHISNYKTSSDKFILSESIQETNSTSVNNGLHSILWANSAPITSIQLTSVINSNGSASTFAENSTAYLYGITNVPSGAKSTGGVITDDASYWYHTFTSSGTFTPNQNLTADILVIAGGGGGGKDIGGGGGAGGLLLHSSQNLSSTSYSITVGSGGPGSTVSAGIRGTNGGNSTFGALTASVGGGAGGAYNTDGGNGATGGSGGGGGHTSTVNAAGTSGQGNQGGRGNSGGSSGGGGGAGAAGSNAVTPDAYGGNGGAGTNAYSSWATATSTGVNGFYAGGGGGAGYSAIGFGTGGSGGGANGAFYVSPNPQNGGAGITNTGGGGGGGSPYNGSGGNGGSGIVIVRYAK